MRQLSFLLLIVGWHLPAPAQNISLADKEAVTTQILQRVGAAYGFGILELPKLVVHAKNRSNRHIAHLQMVSAWLQQPTTSLYRSRLIMDEELVDLCTSVDQKQANKAGSALAFVLAHEMAHFYHRHATFRSFADQTSAAMSEKVSYAQEQQADYTGLLFTYMAGYDPEPVLDNLFDGLYAQYHLADKLWGYPTKTERQQTTKLRVGEFRTFGYLFAVGHALYCREQFDEAARCFEYVFTRYPLKEAYNNFGVCRLQQLTRARKKDAISYFVLPFEIDPRNRLLRLGERGANLPAPRITMWLNEAEAAFGQAISMDPYYQTASLNQAIRALLATNAFLSMGILTTLAQTTNKPLPPDGHLIQAMAYSLNGDWAKADQQFRKAGPHAYQAAYNTVVAQAIRKKTVNTLQYPWKRLRPQKTGCQSVRSLLQEVSDSPASVDWNRATYLIELSNPKPFIAVKVAQMGEATYFQINLGSSTHYFVWSVNHNRP